MIHRFTHACLFVLIVPTWVLAQDTESPKDARRGVGEFVEVETTESEQRLSNREIAVEGAADGSDEFSDLPRVSAQPEREAELDLGLQGTKRAPAATRELLVDILKGKTPEDWPKDPVAMSVTYPATAGRLPAGQQLIDPRSKNLTMDQRREIYLSMNLAAIRDGQERLVKAENEAEKKKILASLKSEYAARFEIDTAYQELKLEEIERRASILRAEVDKRSESQDEWVNAMVTLDKMRANGIETIPSNPPASSTFRSPIASAQRSSTVDALQSSPSLFQRSPPLSIRPIEDFPDQRPNEFQGTRPARPTPATSRGSVVDWSNPLPGFRPQIANPADDLRLQRFNDDRNRETSPRFNRDSSQFVPERP